jgi:hypothetical protein
MHPKLGGKGTRDRRDEGQALADKEARVHGSVADIRSGHGRHHHVQMATKRDAVSDDGLMFMENQTNVPLNKAEELSSNWRTNSQYLSVSCVTVPLFAVITMFMILAIGCIAYRQQAAIIKDKKRGQEEERRYHL